MAITSNTYTGNGSNKLFSITFPYLDTSDIDVYLNGTIQTITTQYTFANATTVEFVAAPANGATVLLDRSTDDTNLQATFFPGSSIKAVDLNENFDQALYIAQETANNVANAVAGLIPDGTITNAKINATAGIDATKLSFTQAGTGAAARTIDSKLKDTVSVKDFGAVGDGTTNDTAAITAALAASNHVYFPPGPYAVTSITIGNFKHLSGYPDFKGIASSATTAIVVINGLRCTFEYLAVDQNFNINYTAAIHWHSLSQATPAQYNRIYSLKLDNCQIGILFGQLNGTAVVNAPQSENSITHMITRGCHTPIYMNQPNGFLFISDSTISSIRNEWPAGDYSYATTATAKIFKGVLRISNSELLKTDTQLGDGVAVTGGAVRFSNCTFEIASKNFSTASGGGTLENATELGLHGCKFYMANATGPFASHSDGILWMSSCKVERASGAKASARGFIEYSGSSTRAFINNVQLYNFLADTLINAGSSPYTFNIPSEFYVNSLHSESTDVSNGLFIPSNAGAISPLIAKGVDLDCNTLDGWFYKLDYGAGSSYSVVASSPTLPLPKKNLVNSIQLVATGSAWVSTLDDTSLATVKSTGIRCTNRQRFLISCWAKESGGQADIGVVTANSSGVATFTSLLGPLSANWEYFQCLYEAAAGVRYIGISIRGIGTTCNITGASLISLE